MFFSDAFATEEEIDSAINNSIDVINIPIIVKKGLSENILNHLTKKVIDIYTF